MPKSSPTSAPRVLTLDIETAPLESYTWGIWEQNVGVDQIKTEWSILSFAAKWGHERKVIYADTGGRGVDKVRDDSILLQPIWDLLDAADIVVAQNGARFDVKKINSRLIMHDFGPYSPIRIVDTLKVAKKHFGFTSNKLAWMSQHLTNTPKSEHKKYPGFQLWLACLADDAKAWAEMRKYNIQDVRATEELYLKQRPWITGHPNLGVYADGADHTCPACNGPNVTKNGFAVLQQGKYQRYHCSDCGYWSRGKQSLISTDKRKALKVAL